ncbi:alpha/beta fold hydrolase [Mycoplasma miroungirhinis]|uniref:Alpha/beta hydrolase n=1 Tax=Mycoplasma miroungirhinis TaxID=754516 RepID=A0A6M4JBK2_9MOLU|nr:alpha/beta hydrolase [Mycoplasma miroungirhinis]QJR44383.1 alpha/beta hydrolase [Mycoplasma miroungirhinis]
MTKIYEIAQENINAFLEDGWEESKKPILLFIHGFGDSWGTIKPIINIKNRPFFVAAIDMPGCGKSSWHVRPLTLEHYFEVVGSFVDSVLKNRDVYVIGHSLGALSALYLLRTHRAKFATLVGPSHYLINKAKIKFGKKYLIPITRENAIESYLKLTNTPEAFKKEAEVYANMIVNNSNLRFKKFHYIVDQQMLNLEYVFENYYDWYKATNNYQLCVGEFDQYTTVEEIQLVAKQMHKKIKIIKNAGHATFYDNAQEIYEFVLEMFK